MLMSCYSKLGQGRKTQVDAAPFWSVNDANADMMATLKGLFVNGANAGTIQLRKKNQGGNVTTTILAGSILRWQKEN